MEYSIKLNSHYQETTVRDLLETQWLIPRKVRHFLRTRKNVLVNQQTARFQDIVRAGDLVTLRFESTDYPTPAIGLGNPELVEILYEDEHLLVLDKAAGIKTHPNAPDEKDTLLNHAAAYLAPKHLHPYIVHRLDKETSGVIVMAKNPVVLPVLGRLLEQKEIYRTYQACVAGNFPQKQWLIQKKIGRDRHDRRKRCIDPKNGKESTTKIRCLHTDASTSHLECELLTGRTHQIRVHLLSIGYPILGDPLYAPQTLSNYPRLMLHAKKISLLHPFTKERFTVESSHSIW